MASNLSTAAHAYMEGLEEFEVVTLMLDNTGEATFLMVAALEVDDALYVLLAELTQSEDSLEDKSGLINNEYEVLIDEDDDLFLVVARLYPDGSLTTVTEADEELMTFLCEEFLLLLLSSLDTPEEKIDLSQEYGLDTQNSLIESVPFVQGGDLDDSTGNPEFHKADISTWLT